MGGERVIVCGQTVCQQCAASSADAVVLQYHWYALEEASAVVVSLFPSPRGILRVYTSSGRFVHCEVSGHNSSRRAARDTWTTVWWCCNTPPLNLPAKCGGKSYLRVYY
jgi:hypothetical protein